MREKMLELVKKMTEIKKLMRELSGEETVPLRERSIGNFLMINAFHYMDSYIEKMLFRYLPHEEAYNLLKTFERD